MEFQPSEEELQQLREWIAKTPHVLQNYDDKFLAGIIRGCKGSLQKTKTVLESFNGFGMKYPEFFGSYDPLHPRLQEHLSETRMFVLPKKTEDGCTVFFFCSDPKATSIDPYKCHSLEYYRYWLLSIYVLLWENDFGSGKWIFISDVKHSSLAQWRDYNSSMIRKVINLTQSIPIRVKSSHIINLPSIAEFFIQTFKKILKAKLAERITVYSDPKPFLETFPQKILPKEYGGFDESVNELHERWKKKVESYRDRFLEEESKMRKLDPFRPKTEDVDEMEGTFKQLNVD